MAQIRFGKADSEWHRIALDRDSETRTDRNVAMRTACDKAIGDNYYATREPKYEEPLCKDGCFTPYELKLAQEIASSDSTAAFEAESQARAIQREDSRRMARVRLDDARAKVKPSEDE